MTMNSTSINTTTLLAVPFIVNGEKVRGDAGTNVQAWSIDQNGTPWVAFSGFVGGLQGSNTIPRDKAGKYLAAVPPLASEVSAAAISAAPIAPVAAPAPRAPVTVVTDYTRGAGQGRYDSESAEFRSRNDDNSGSIARGGDAPAFTGNFSRSDTLLRAEGRFRDVSDVAGVLKLANLDWEVTKHIAKGQDPDTGLYFDLPSAWIRREDTKEVLTGSVGRNYQPVQNRDAFAVLDGLIGGGAEFVGAGSFNGGGSVFIQLDVKQDKEIVKGDLVKSYVLVRNSHDGSGSYLVRATPVRVVCYNTLTHASFASQKAGNTIFGKLRHTKNVGVKIADIGAVLKGLREQQAVAFDLYAALAAKPVTQEMVSAVFSQIGVFQMPTDPEAERAAKNARERRDAVLELFEGKGAGAAMPGVQGTAWGLYNAVAEWSDWTFAQNARDAEGRDETRLLTRGADVKETALEALAGVAGLRM